MRFASPRAIRRRPYPYQNVNLDNSPSAATLISNTLPAYTDYQVEQPYTYDPSLDLNPGDPGVVTLFSGLGNTFAPINLGTNTFSFYGQTYTGDELYVSTDGLITLGQGWVGRGRGPTVGLRRPHHARHCTALGQLDHRRRRCRDPLPV